MDGNECSERPQQIVINDFCDVDKTLMFPTVDYVELRNTLDFSETEIKL